MIFPGVGEAGSAMQYLKERGLDNTIRSLRQPVLGICLGLQLMCRFSEEADTGAWEFLMRMSDCSRRWTRYPIWDGTISSPLKEIFSKTYSINDDVYYVHSYYAEISSCTSATCDYILPFSAAMEKDNFYATQFHPEKSAEVGEKILRNFLEL